MMQNKDRNVIWIAIGIVLVAIGFALMSIFPFNRLIIVPGYLLIAYGALSILFD